MCVQALRNERSRAGNDGERGGRAYTTLTCLTPKTVLPQRVFRISMAMSAPWVLFEIYTGVGCILGTEKISEDVFHN